MGIAEASLPPSLGWWDGLPMMTLNFMRKISPGVAKMYEPISIPPQRLVTVVVVHVHLHLPNVLVRELAKLQIEEHKTAQEPVVEHEVHLEVVLLVGEALLPAHEGVSAPQLEEELLQVVDDARLQVAL